MQQLQSSFRLSTADKGFSVQAAVIEASLTWRWPKLEAISIDQEVGQVEELGGQLLDVAAVNQAVLPGGRHAGKQSVRMVEPPALLCTRPQRMLSITRQSLMCGLLSACLYAYCSCALPRAPNQAQSVQTRNHFPSMYTTDSFLPFWIEQDAQGYSNPGDVTSCKPIPADEGQGGATDLMDLCGDGDSSKDWWQASKGEAAQQHLEVAVEACEGLQADEVEEDRACSAVVGPVVEGRHVRLGLQQSHSMVVHSRASIIILWKAQVPCCANSCSESVQYIRRWRARGHYSTPCKGSAYETAWP